MYWNEEDDAIIAEIPELPGCVADGHTYEEAPAMIQEVMDIWIETQKEMGHTIPKDRLTLA